MDATENDLPPSAPFRIAGFPTLKFKKAGSKDFIDYEGDRTLESLVAFIEENASHPLEKKSAEANETTPSDTPLEAAAQEPISVEHGTAAAHAHEHHDEL